MNETPSTLQQLVHIWQPNICAGCCSTAPCMLTATQYLRRTWKTFETANWTGQSALLRTTLGLCNMQTLNKLPVNATCQAFQTVSLCSNPPRPPPPLLNLINECGIVRRHNTYTHNHTHALNTQGGQSLLRRKEKPFSTLSEFVRDVIFLAPVT